VGVAVKAKGIFLETTTIFEVEKVGAGAAQAASSNNKQQAILHVKEERNRVRRIIVPYIMDYYLYLLQGIMLRKAWEGHLQTALCGPCIYLLYASIVLKVTLVGSKKDVPEEL
jgi:hypothetical protein